MTLFVEIVTRRARILCFHREELDQNLLLSLAIFQVLQGVSDQLYLHNESAKKGVFSQVKKWKGVNAEVV
mgnify:CR=1 FL=1